MPEISPTSQQEIAQLEQMLAEKKALLERQQQSSGAPVVEAPHDREMIAEIVKEKLAATPGTQAPQQPVPQPAPQGHAVPSYASDDLHAKVQELVELAFAKSLNEAIVLAKATQNAALIDAFHDMMVDELYDHLVETGKLEKI
ncbi:MAG: hypothetical protein HY007_04425 [Candidatus Sungbacteria bacterium]|nr:hypothetical protein [Candidatus Sungbacteria bacterium]